MRRLLAAGLGFGFALSPLVVTAQQPAGRSPVRLVGVRAADDGIVPARAQAPLPPMGNPVPMPMPMGGTQPPMPMPMGSGTPAQLGMPKPLGQGPTIREAPGTPMPVPMGGVTLGPAAVVPGETPHPTTTYPGGAYNPGVQLDAPLYDGCYPAPQATYTPPAYGQLLAPYGRGSAGRWWLSGEYLLWFTKAAEYPALLTTSSPAFAGIQGSGDTRTIFGNSSFGDTLHSGGRFAVGRYFGADQRWGLEGSAFFLATNRDSFTANSGDFPVLARPFFNVNQNIPFSEVITSPGLSTGGARIDTESALWGAEANVLRRLGCNPCSRLDLIGGFRYLDLREQVTVTESFVRTADSNTGIGVPTAAAGTVFDSFRTTNQFYGGTIGLTGERRRGRWFANLTTKVSLGTVYQTAEISGGQTITFTNGGIANYAGGLLTAPGANLGTFTQNKFAVVPEVGFKLGYQVTPYCRAFVGYNFLYLSSALRPGDQIDPNLDITRIPNFPVPGVSPFPVVRPSVPLKDKDFFAQGVSFGLQWRW